MADEQTKGPSLREALSSALKDAEETEQPSSAPKLEEEAPEGELEVAPASEDRPRGADGKFLPKDAAPKEEKSPPAAKAPKAAPAEPSPEAVTSPAKVEAPQHWSQADKDTFGKQTPEAQEWLMRRYKEIEGGATKRIGSLTPLEPVIQRHADYIRSLGATPEQAFDVLVSAERSLRMGTPEQKQAALLKLAADYQIPLPSGTQQPASAPAQAAQPQTHWDPTVTALQQELATIKQAVTSRQQADVLAEQNRILADIQAFETAKTETGQPAHPYFAEVTNDIALLAQAERQAGRVPQLKDLYDKAIWANPTTRQKLVAEQAAAEAKKREDEAKAKAAQAAKAGKSINGAPRGGANQSSVPAGSLREEITRNLGEGYGRV